MNSLPVRVLYLNHAAKPSGAEIALRRMLNACDRRRVQPIIVFGEEGPAADLMREIDVATYVLPLAGKVREARKDTLGVGAFMHLGRLVALGVYAVRLAAFARRHKVQIIHTNTIKAHFYGGIAGCLAGLPVVWHLRDFVNESYFPGAAVRVIRFLARRLPRHVIAVSHSVMEQLRFDGEPGRATVVLDGLADQELGTEKSEPAPRETIRTCIGIVGRLSRWKGQHVFLDAAARVLAAEQDAEFVIIGSALFGEDAYEQSLRRQAEALGIAHRVRFRGFTSDVSGELSKLDLLVHASTSGEPFGQVILEGMAAGLPVIATRGGGVPEIISDGENGLLTRMGDPADLAAALLALLSDPAKARRLGDNGYRHVREKFRASRAAQTVADIYQDILA